MANDILKYFSAAHGDFLHAEGLKSTGVVMYHLGCQQHESILEIGFGTGSTLVELAQKYEKTQFFGMERSDSMFRTALKRAAACGVSDRISLYLMQDKNNPFHENQFDKIYLESVLAIQNKEDLQNLLMSIHNWLKPGGKLICNETIWLPSVSTHEIEQINRECMTRFGIIQATGDYPYVSDWEQLFTSSGLKIVLSNSIQEEKNPFQIEQSKDSKRFTQKGKIRSKLNLKMRREWKEYKKAMDEIIPSERQLMEGWLFVLVNEKNERGQV